MSTPNYDKIVAKYSEPAEPISSDFKPDISKRVRTIAYFATFIIGAICVLIGALAPIWLDEIVSGKVALTMVAILAFVSTIGGLFGIIYRPTKV